MGENGRLPGSYWGYSYHIRDPRAQEAFEIMSRALFDHHHADNNPHHLIMQVDYECQLLGQAVKGLRQLAVGDKRLHGKRLIIPVSRDEIRKILDGMTHPCEMIAPHINEMAPVPLD